ncbi:MAG TPA: sulfite exporter TauE/SafE family protein [Ignavibacteria bacterium]|nr:sulfite exporter TauE/SafE family protein [Ignavibacteria bacterium]
MEIVIIAVVAAAASLLTFFSGFGLGTILTPVLVIFFPVEFAIALSGIVHLLNNFFKIGLVAGKIDWKLGLKFGITAAIGAFAGAELLLIFSKIEPVYTYVISSKMFYVTYIKIIISVLMIVFALFEIVPFLNNIRFKGKMLYLGGLLSGFFGGVSGNQGALRSAFLLRLGLTKEGFIATGIMIACMVDITRLSVYFSRLSVINLSENILVLISAVLSAFWGAYIGSKLLKKITLKFVQYTVAVMILTLAIGLGVGLL